MSSGTVHLPNGHNVTVHPVFGGLSFKSIDLNVHHTSFPPGWTIVLQTKDEEVDRSDQHGRDQSPAHNPRDSLDSQADFPPPEPHTHRFRVPTLHNDRLFLSSLSYPSSTDFKPAASATRQIAMMLWTSLYWYFHQPEPDLHLDTVSCAHTAEEGKPKGEWLVYINREGVFRGRNLLQKLERMGLISSRDSTVGLDIDGRSPEGWKEMFVSRRSFWQLDPRIFLFTLSPTLHSPLAGSPYPSRPGSPNSSTPSHSRPETAAEANALATSQGLWAPSTTGPFSSSSHLPTYFPPPPLQYTFTDHVRHPIRPKPPRQGETFYTRFIPSIGQYLSFRVASISPKAPAHLGPSSHHAVSLHNSLVGSLAPSDSLAPLTPFGPSTPCDIDLLYKWMNEPRVARAWGEQGPREQQEAFLRKGLLSKHSFPVIGCWDGKPFGFFEVYWVKEDRLGRHLNGSSDPWDRGLHCLVGEQDFRGSHRVRVWISALVHYCFLADNRTHNVLLEPRVDNKAFIRYLEEAGFHKEREVAFPHKQAALMRIRREAWEAPAL
ncbi:MAG: hypothetical protein M1825_006239 [Sarcosagium campestre]|nr:MAG: hypothetical protein M1825_006239 [Sarcosagium campestre]